jgi:hypothetical protein
MNNDPHSGDLRPIPDPTVLTTQQLLREIQSVREIFETRLDGYDKAINLIQAMVDKSPSIAELNARTDERFKSVLLHSDDRAKEIHGRIESVKELKQHDLLHVTSKIEDLSTAVDARFEAAQLAVSSALAAQDKLTSAIFAASEKAITKAEEAQREYNIRSNEFRGQLDDQAKSLISRLEAQTVFKALEDKIDGIKDEQSTTRVIIQSLAQQSAVVNLRNELMVEISNLRESRSESGGHEKAIYQDKQQSNWNIGTIIAVLIGLAAIISELFFKH